MPDSRPSSEATPGKPIRPPAPALPSPPPTEIALTETTRIRRLGWGLVTDATLSFVAMEKGFLFTLRAFWRDPRAAFESYLGAGRLRFSNPLKLVIFLVAVATFLNYQQETARGVSAGFANRAAESGADPARTAEQLAALEQFFRQNQNLLLLAALPVLALVSRLLYWKRAYNWMEHLALNSFLFAFTTIAYLFFLALMTLSPSLGLGYVLFVTVYQTWIYRRVLGPGWGRALLTTALSFVAYYALLALAILVWFKATLG